MGFLKRLGIAGWALEILRENNDKEIEERTKIHENINKTILATQNQLDNLTKMRIRELINDDEYKKEKLELQAQIVKFRNQLRNTEKRADEWLELTEKTFNFATYAKSAFQNGDIQTKKEIFMALGSDSTLIDGKLNINASEWLQPIKRDYLDIEADYKRFGPMKNGLNKSKNEALGPIITRWHAYKEFHGTP